MKVIYGKNNFPTLSSSVVTIGIFDGVHKAHQALIKKTISHAKRDRKKSVVITFWPHPAKVIHKRQIGLLTSLEHKLRLIRELKPDYILLIHFTPLFAKSSIDKFSKEILVNKLNAKAVYVGEDFRFGKGRKGSVNDLIRLGKNLGFKTFRLKSIKYKGEKLGSSLIRNLISETKFDEANSLLARKFSIIGKVVHGDRRGRSLGYPTANLIPKDEILPPDGIYAVELLLDKKHFFGICFIGNVPTFRTEKRIEVHIFNYRKSIYNRILEIKFLHFIRKSKKFSDAAKLTEQISKDIKIAKSTF